MSSSKNVCDNHSPILEQGLFTFRRDEGFPTRYDDHLYSPAHVDILTAGLILAFLLVAFCLYITLPAYKYNRRWHLFIYTTLSLFIGAGIVVGNYGHEWEVGRKRILTPYKPGSSEELHADLGLHIALRGVNITLRNASSLSEDFGNEVIDYNEHFSWEWAQGRFGFGKYAGQISKDFRAAVLRGTPFPILQVAEYFTFDGEGLRFGRHYRLAGYYAHIMMWTAFPMWIVTNILFFMVVHDGAVMLMMTGLCQLVANAIWYFLRNPIELHIPFEAPPSSLNVDGKDHVPMPEVILETKFGPDYWLVVFNGCLCLLLGLVVLVLNEYFPDAVCKFFNIDPLSAYDEAIVSNAEELQHELDDHKSKNFKLQPGGGLRIEGGKVKISIVEPQLDNGDQKRDSDGEVTERDSENRTVLRRRENAGSKFHRHIQNSFRIKPNIKPRKQAIDDAESFKKKVDSIEEENELNELGSGLGPGTASASESTPLLKPVEEAKYTIENEEEEKDTDDEPTYDNLPPLKSALKKRKP